jgi:hypothetical protein
VIPAHGLAADESFRDLAVGQENLHHCTCAWIDLFIEHGKRLVKTLMWVSVSTAFSSM